MGLESQLGEWTTVLDIVTPENRHMYRDQLEDMFRMRHRAAVQEMGWRIEIDEQGRDVDEFDYPDTVYILYFNPDGSVGACARLNPTTRPHLLSEVFPDMCVEGAPASPAIWEYSRYLIERRGKSQQEYMRAWMLVSQAVNEWCIDNGIEKVTWLAAKRLYSMSTKIWTTRPLGPAKYYEDDGKEYIAAISTMDADSLKRVERYSRQVSPVTRTLLPLSEAV